MASLPDDNVAYLHKSCCMRSPYLQESSTVGEVLELAREEELICCVL